MGLPKFKQLYEVMQIRGVKVYAHWSVLLIGAIILIWGYPRALAFIRGLGQLLRGDPDS